MVFCPNCGIENADSAKFCKQCGHGLMANSPIKDNYVNTGIDPSARVNDNSNSNNSINNSNNSKSDNKNLIIICLTIVIAALLIAGALVMFSNSNANDNDSDALSDSVSLNGNSSLDDSLNNDSDVGNTAQTAQVSSPQILSGSFSTGSSSSDKTYCTIYVGSEHAGEKVKISVLYSNNGYALNQGKIVPKTVSSDGYVKVASASAFDYYPDDAYITLYDNKGNVLDTQEVYLSERSGKQTF